MYLATNFTDKVKGLNSTWSNNVQANPNVPILSQPFPYGSQPIKGVCIGGWLILEVLNHLYLKLICVAIYNTVIVLDLSTFPGYNRRVHIV
jgi:hypothetical protein